MAKRRAGASGRRKRAGLGRGGMAVLVHTVKRSAQDPTGEKGKIDPGENLLCGDESVRNRGNRYDPGGGKTGPLLRTDPFLSESPAHLTRGRRETAPSAAITRDTTGPIYSTRNGKNKKKQKGTQLRAWKKGKRV
jgi:hypothetical protein